ncbi:hypothetical protein EJ07DRAFT_185841 [Lizonia empirigonia]|nr:hypothetical protein EJ07DRAFT_185841 [Lizonia empirigonia]
MSRVDGEWVFEGLDKECAVLAIEHQSGGDYGIVAHMHLRRQKLWEAFRLGCKDLQQIWLEQQDPSFCNIRLMAKLLQSDAPEELPSETSLTTQLGCIQQKLLATYRVFGEHPVRALLLKHIRRQESVAVLAAALVKTAGAYEDDSFWDCQIAEVWSSDKVYFRCKEMELLKVLEYQLGWPGPLFFLENLVNNLTSMSVVLNGPLPSSAEVTAFILKASLFNTALVQQLPSVVAAAAHCLAISMVEEAPWTAEMERVSQHSFDEIFPVMRSMCRFHGEAKARIVAIDSGSREIADFVTSKIRAGFVVTRRYTFNDAS